jgi:hypothetical protein
MKNHPLGKTLVFSFKACTRLMAVYEVYSLSIPAAGPGVLRTEEQKI